MKAQFYPWSYPAKQTTIVDETTGEKTYERSGRKLFGIVWTEPSGKVHKERTGLLTLTLARQAVEKKRKEVQEADAKGLDTVAGPRAVVTLKQAVQERIDSQENDDTRTDYQSKLDTLLLPFFGNVPLASIKPAQVMAYIDKRKKDGAAPGTIKKDLALLSGTFSDAELKEQVDRNPIRLARRGKQKALHEGKKIVRFLSPEEELRLYAVLPPRKPFYQDGTNVNGSVLRDAVPFALLTGLREMEQARLTWADYDPERRVIRVMEQKNGNQDELPLCDAAAGILERLRAEALEEAKGLPAAIRKLHIFRDPETRKPLTRFNNTAWANALRKADIEGFRWHDCRHSFASRLALAGASLQYVQRMMRHHSINQTLAYAHLCPEDNATGIDFQGRKGVALLDCYQDYQGLLFTPAKSLAKVGAQKKASALATLPA